MKEYRMPKKFVVTWGCIALIAMVFGVYALFEIFEKGIPEIGIVFFLKLLLGLSFPVLFTGMWLHFGCLKYTTYTDKIVFYQILRKRELLLSEAAGFVEISPDGRILLLPKSQRKKSIVISTWIQNKEELESWIFTNLTDLEEIVGEE